MGWERRSVKRVAAPLTAAALLLGASAGPASAQSLQQRLGSDVTVSKNRETGKVGFIGARPGQPIRQAGASAATSAAAESAARSFLRGVAADFGLNAATARVMRVGRPGDGRASVRFQQTHGGVPVLAGEVIVNLDADGNVLSAGGEATPDPSLRTTPRITAAAARATALARAAKTHRVQGSALKASAPALTIYDNRLLGGPGQDKAVLVFEVEVTGRAADGNGIRELVLVDAQTGGVALNFNQIANAKVRKVCDAANADAHYPCEAPVRSEGQPPHAVVDVNDSYDFSGDTYDFLKSAIGRDSLDGRGMPMVSTVRYCEGTCPFENAFWDGEQMTYGEGFAAADDVVGHEFGHGYTEFTSNLLYYYQSGAINEHISDVIGEFVDQSNGRGTDTAAVKWQLGEDLPPSVGVIRDMKNPPAHEQPDKMTSSLYWPFESDSGGVHFNSGVGNKAAYLLTDGGSFNGKTVSGLGRTKVARIYNEAQTSLLTSGADYLDLYFNLRQACFNLAGGRLGIVLADCTQVANATQAVEMNVNPPAAPTPTAAECPTSGQVPKFTYWDDLEGPLKLKATGTPGSWIFPIQGYSTSGKFSAYAPNAETLTDASLEMLTAQAVPASAFFAFNHSYDFEADDGGTYDGGIVEYSTNGGTTWTDAKTLIQAGGYNGTISEDFDNPLKGRSAYVDRSHGYGAARVNLSSLAGQSVKFRFRIATDSLIDDFGWVVDDLRIYTCAADTTAPVAKAPTANLLANQQLGANTSVGFIPTLLSWADATDDRSPARRIRYLVQQSVNGAAFTSQTAFMTRRTFSTNLRAGTRYQYRVLARDEAGNTSVAATGAAFIPTMNEENAAGLTYTGTWLTRSASTGASGGFVRASTAAGAKVAHSFVGSAVGVVMNTASTLGNAKVCLFKGATSLGCTTVDTSPGSNVPRKIVWSRGGLDNTSTYRVEVSNVSGRIELDAITTYKKP